MKKKRVLKIWNGRCTENLRGTHLFLAAYSQADACRMLSELYPRLNPSQWNREMTIYFNKNCWGNTMEGITPERGVWLQENEYTDHATLKRIYPIVKTEDNNE
jgi:hypothetical protein